MGSGGCGDGSALQGTAVELFQLASLLMGDQQEAVALVEQTLASVEIDPCLDPAAARELTRARVLAFGLERLRELDPQSFSGVPAVNTVCVEDDDLSSAGISQTQLAGWLAGEGRQDLRDWLAALPGAQRAIFVQRAVLGQGNGAVAEALGEGAWSADAVGEMYRLALCSLANSLAHSTGVLAAATGAGASLAM